MRRETVLLAALVVLCPPVAHGSFERVPGDAEGGALADAGVGQKVSCARAFGNPGQLAWAHAAPFRATSGNLYGIDALGWWSAWGGLKAGANTVAGGVVCLGGSEYREITLGVSLGRRMGASGYGIGVRVLHLGVGDLVSRWGLVMDVGVLERVNEHVSFGVLVSGIGSGDDAGSGSFGLPRVVVGCSFRPAGNVVVLVDAEQASDGPRRARIGLELPLGYGACLRAGRMTEPGEICFGIGVRKRGMGVDTSIRWHPVLGFSHRVTVLLGAHPQMTQTNP